MGSYALSHSVAAWLFWSRILFLWFLWCLKRNPDWVSCELCVAFQDHWLYTIAHIASVFFSVPLAAECEPQLAFTWRRIQYIWNQLTQRRKHSPAIYHRLIQTALEKGEAPECLQYIDHIMYHHVGWIAEEVFEKGKKVIHILLEASFAIKQRKVKGPAWKIQFLGITWQNRHHQILMHVINRITGLSTPTSKKFPWASLGVMDFQKMCILDYGLIANSLYQVTFGLENQVLWWHGTPGRIESDRGTHFWNNLVDTWAKEHGTEWVYHVPYRAPASGLLKITLRAMGAGMFKLRGAQLAKATWLINAQVCQSSWPCPVKAITYCREREHSRSAHGKHPGHGRSVSVETVCSFDSSKLCTEEHACWTPCWIELD